MKHLLFFFILLLAATTLHAQPPTEGKIVDEIVAIVGENYILRSDIDKEFATIDEQTEEAMPDGARFQILNSLIAKKILLYQAQLDSIVIPEDRLNGEIDRRMAYILAQFKGGEEEFAAYLGKSIEEFKAQTREKLREELLIQEMQQKILKDIKITPTDVKKYYNSIPVDSLPYIDAEVTVAQLVRFPKITKEEKEYAYNKLAEIKKEIEEGASFESMAHLYSDDPLSAIKDGELGFFSRGQMLAEFESAAFKLKPDTVSRIVETAFGYHILKLIERRGERVNVRHILIKPKNIPYDLTLARDALDTLLPQIKTGKISFEEAAKKYSDDENTAANGGKISDNLGNFKVAINSLEKDVFEAVNTMQAGDYLGPKYVRVPVNGEEKDCYKLYHLISITQPHVANLDEDWIKVQNAALDRKKAEALENWIKRHKKDFYIKVNGAYAAHPTLQHWVKK